MFLILPIAAVPLSETLGLSSWPAFLKSPVCSDWSAGPLCCDWSTKYKQATERAVLAQAAPTDGTYETLGWLSQSVTSLMGEFQTGMWASRF